MEFVLNIYNKDKEVEKTYRTNDFMLMTGTAEEIISIIEIEKFGKNMTDNEMYLEVVKLVMKFFPLFNPLMKDMFVGLTDDEYQRTNLFELGKLVYDVVVYIVNQLTLMMPAGPAKKN